MLLTELAEVGAWFWRLTSRPIWPFNQGMQQPATDLGQGWDGFDTIGKDSDEDVG